MTRRPEHLGKRKEFGVKVKRQAAERSKGVCEAHLVPALFGLPKTCEREAKDFDHVQADGLCGEPTLDNCAHLCGACHTIKTAIDTRMMRKADRAAGRSGQYKRRKKNGSRLQSRGFAGHRKMNGEIVWKT